LKEELWFGRSPVKRSRGFIEVRLNVSQTHDTAARKQNKAKPLLLLLLLLSASY
jgi:hypothetical protein